MGRLHQVLLPGVSSVETIFFKFKFSWFRQQRAKWTVRLANVRLSSRAPWEQERRIVGMVASPVEQQSIVLLKLDREAAMSGA